MFKGSFRIGTFFGIGVYVHWTWLLLLAVIAMASADEGRGAMLMVVALYVSVFICVTLHEYGHALTARRFGIRTEDITLLPIGGVARLEKMPENPLQELLVAVAGPAVNIVIAGILWAIRREALPQIDAPMRVSQFTFELLRINLLLVLFNAIPAFPMDGGRVLRSVLAMVMNRVKATQIAASIGQMLAIVGGMYGVLIARNFLLGLIAVFIYFGAAAEARAVTAAEMFRGVRVRDVMIRRFASLPPEAPLDAAVEELLAGSQHDFPVVEQGRIVGLLTRTDLIKALARRTEPLTVAAVMQTSCAIADAGDLLDSALQTMQRAGCPALPVVEGGRLVGLLTSENISEFVMVQTARRG